MNKNSGRLIRIRVLLIFFMSALVLSGLTAIPLEYEVGLLRGLIGPGSWFGSFLPAISTWVERVDQGIRYGYGQYPFLAYGTDWLAFGHIAIALAFIGAVHDPVRNVWVVQFGMIACLLVIPWALIFSFVRGIPFLWMLVDMSFGIVGILPLWLARREILRLAAEA